MEKSGPKLKISLSAKIIGVFVSLSLCFLPVFAYFNISQHREALEQSFLEKAKTIARLLDSGIRSNEQIKNKTGLIDYIQKHMWLNPDILNIDVVVAKNGKLATIISNQIQRTKLAPSAQSIESFRRGALRHRIIEKDHGRVLQISMPIHEAKKQIGVFQIELTLENIDQEIENATLNYIWSFLVIVSAFVIILFLYLRITVIRPIRLFSQEVRGFAHSNFRKTIDLKANNEIGELIDAFNRMTLDLSKAEERFRSLAESAPDAIVTRDSESRLIYWNMAAGEMFGYTADEARNLEDFELLAPDCIPKYKQLMTAAKNKSLFGQRLIDLEFSCINKNGEAFPVEMSVSFWESQQSIFRTEIYRDISDRRQAETERDEALFQFHEAQKHESLGTLAAGIAHDFNNILGIINGYTHLILDDLPDGSVHRDMLEGVIRAGERGADLVHQILAYTRRDSPSDAIVRIAQSLSDNLRMLRATLPATIQLDSQIPDLQACVRLDESRVHQLLSNLCINAAHAIGSAAGRITVSCKAVKLGRKGAAGIQPLLASKSADAIAIKTRPDGQGGKLWFGALSDGDHVCLTVEDDGSGIDGATLDRVLEPFFTTKEVGNGTGLGLSAVAGTLRSCQGGFLIDTKVGRGTRFDVYLPIVEDVSASSDPGDSELRGVERILLVEDATKLRREAVSVFGELGYEITALADGASALKAFEKATDAWDLIVTDQALPGLTGIELAKRILELKPDMPIVMISGTAQTTLKADAKALGVAEFHLKPLNAAKLVQIVRRVLDKKPVRTRSAA